MRHKQRDMRRADEIMTSDPACCGPETPLTQVARMMVENDCGCVPVIDDAGRPLGVVTDRDIACRAVARNLDARALCAADCMTTPVVSVARDETVDECCELLESNQIRRVLVVDDDGACCGIVALADIARKAENKTEDVVEAVSRPSHEASVPAGM